MWHRAPHYLKSALLIVLVYCPLLVAGAGDSKQQDEEQPRSINLPILLKEVGKVNLPNALPESTLIDEILRSGVDFELTSMVEGELKKAGASGDVIQAIRDSKLCNSVGRIVIAVVPENGEYDDYAEKVYKALTTIRCPSEEPKRPDTPAKIDDDSKPIEIRYFDKSDNKLVKDIADYLKRKTQVDIKPVLVQKSLKERRQPRKEKIELDIYFLFKK